MCFATLEAGAALAAPWIGGTFADRLLSGQDSTGYQRLLLIWLGLLLTQYLLNFAGSYLMGSAGYAATAHIRSRLYDHLQSLPVEFHHRHPVGQTLSLLSRDASILGQFFTTTLPGLAPQAIMLIGAWVLMARIDLTLAVWIGFLIPALVLLLKLTLRRLRPIATALATAHGNHLSVAEENLRLLMLLKAFSREPLESARVRDMNHAILRLEKRHLLLAGAVGPAMQSIGAILLITLLWLSAERLADGVLTTGGAVSLLLYGLMLVRPASALASALGNAQSTAGASERIQQALAVAAEPLDQGHAAAPAEPGRCKIEQLCFSYPGRPPVLSNFNLEIEPGEVVALTGPNGTGKSTLAHLMMRFANPGAGRIMLDGVDIRDLSLNALRGAIGFVPQAVQLLEGTIRENICYGVHSCDDEALEQAARTAQAWPFIERLPDGLDTLIGQNGVQLSGGQRQQLALARALLRDCPILILDEATSMFDSASEQAFIKMTRRTLGRTTLILITHRPASLALADRVVDMGRAGKAAPNRISATGTSAKSDTDIAGGGSPHA